MDQGNPVGGSHSQERSSQTPLVKRIGQEGGQGQPAHEGESPPHAGAGHEANGLGKQNGVGRGARFRPNGDGHALASCQGGSGSAQHPRFHEAGTRQGSGNREGGAWTREELQEERRLTAERGWGAPRDGGRHNAARDVRGPAAGFARCFNCGEHGHYTSWCEGRNRGSTPPVTQGDEMNLRTPISHFLELWKEYEAMRWKRTNEVARCSGFQALHNQGTMKLGPANRLVATPEPWSCNHAGGPGGGHHHNRNHAGNLHRRSMAAMAEAVFVQPHSEVTRNTVEAQDDASSDEGLVGTSAETKN